MSKGKTLILALLAAVLGSAAAFSAALFTGWEPGWVTWNPGRTKIVLLAGSAALQAWVYYGGRPKRLACVAMMRDHFELLHENAQDVRVSLMAVRRYWPIVRWWRGFRGHALPGSHLRVVRRAPEDDVVTRVRLHKNEGIAGLAWKLRARVEKQDLPDPAIDPVGYAKATQAEFGLPPEKTALLNRRCRSYVCCPVFDGTDHGDVRGVLCVDSLQDQAFSSQDMNEIERFARYLCHVPF